MGLRTDHDAILNSVAEALVLVDADDADSVNELAACLDSMAGLFDVGIAPGHPMRRCADLLDRFREGDGSVLAELMDAFDEAKTLLAADGVGEEAQQPAAAMPLAGDDELLRDFAIRAFEHLDEADERLIAIESQGAGADAVDAAFRAFHTIKGMAGFLALDEVSQKSHAAEALLSEPRTSGTIPEPSAIQALFVAVDGLRAAVAQAVPSVGQRALSNHQPQMEPVQAGGPGEQALATTSDALSSVRVDEARLDSLLDTIGELVISESMVSAAVRNGEAATLDGQLERLDKITRELQHMATSLRMVPMRATFRRIARLVRDLSHKAGKPVDLVLVGEDIELDKSVVDRMYDPLVHAVRNAVDHGVETPAERAAAGKPETATIRLAAYHAGGTVHIDLTDDGRGVSRDMVRAKAIASGLLSEREEPSDTELLSFIFEPGFSTAEKVTDISGRGVGMDVVRTTVEGLRGRIEIRSVEGEGTTISVQLPVTLAIIDGLVCRVGDERYIIPVLSIERSIRPLATEVHSVKGQGRMVATEDGLIPVIGLHRLFDVSGAEEDPANGVVVIIDEGGKRAGLLVCELLGQQQTVIKPLDQTLRDQPGLAGAAIMSDGRVGLILDAAGLVRSAHGKE